MFEKREIEKIKKRERSIAVVVRATKNARSILYLYRRVITGACTLSKTPVGFSEYGGSREDREKGLCGEDNMYILAFDI